MLCIRNILCSLNFCERFHVHNVCSFQLTLDFYSGGDFFYGKCLKIENSFIYYQHFILLLRVNIFCKGMGIYVTSEGNVFDFEMVQNINWLFRRKLLCNKAHSYLRPLVYMCMERMMRCWKRFPGIFSRKRLNVPMIL